MRDPQIIRPDFRKHARARRDLPDRKTPLVTDSETGERPLCRHEFMAVLSLSRVIVCRNTKCRAQLDPFEVLVRLTRQWETCTWLDNEIAQRKKRIEELKRQEQNVKARVRRAGGTP